MINSKRKGNAFETEIAFRLRSVFPDCRTSRFMGQLWLDSQKVDLTGTDPFYFQCKNTERNTGYHQILSEMMKNGNTNIVIHKKNNKNDFINLIKNRK